MAIFTGTIRSEALAMDTGLSMILPYDRPAQDQQNPCKVLYLLHGLGDNHQAWTRYTNIESYARKYGIAVVMPEVQRSFYANMEYGLNYFDYIAKELPKKVCEMFSISKKPKDTYIAGLSMGGYGALKCGLTFPENYAGCASFSGAVNIRKAKELVMTVEEENQLIGVMGTELEIREKDDILTLAKNLKEKLPIYLSCGTEDYLYEMNKEFVEHLISNGIEHEYEEWAGEHDWKFWDVSVQKALRFFENIG